MQKKLNFILIAPCLFAIIVDNLGFGLVYPILVEMFAPTKSSILPLDTPKDLRDFYLGLGFFLYPLFTLFGASFMGDLSDRIGRKRVLGICMSGLSISFLLMGFAINSFSLWLLFFGRALSGLMAGSFPVAQAAIADLSTKNNKAFNMSFSTGALSVGVLIGPLVGGVFSESKFSSYFNYSTPFYIASFLALISLIWIILGFKETYRSGAVKKIDLTRPVRLFIEGFQHKSIRLLAIVFAFSQTGWGVYYEFTSVFLKDHFRYDSLHLGLFDGFLGASSIAGMLIVYRYVIRYISAYKVATYSLLILGVYQIFTAVFPAVTLDFFSLSSFLSSIESINFLKVMVLN